MPQTATADGGPKQVGGAVGNIRAGDGSRPPLRSVAVPSLEADDAATAPRCTAVGLLRALALRPGSTQTSRSERCCVARYIQHSRPVRVEFRADSSPLTAMN